MTITCILIVDMAHETIDWVYNLKSQSGLKPIKDKKSIYQ